MIALSPRNWGALIAANWISFTLFRAQQLAQLGLYFHPGPMGSGLRPFTCELGIFDLGKLIFPSCAVGDQSSTHLDIWLAIDG